MAKVKFTAIVAQMSGKLAGSVFARGRFGNYIRTLTSPINSNTPFQQRVRSLFSKVITGWYNLTDDQREAWNSGAALAGQKVSFGDSFNYTGRVLYSQLNRNLQEINEAMITTPPVMEPAQSFNTFSVDIDETPGSEDIKMSFDPAISTDTKVIVYATPILNRGAVSISPRWYRKIAVLDNTFLTGSSIKADYLSIFKTMPATGQRVGFKMKSVAKSSGKPEYPLEYVATGSV
jgi:hypothetical protein